MTPLSVQVLFFRILLPLPYYCSGVPRSTCPLFPASELIKTRVYEKIKLRQHESQSLGVFKGCIENVFQPKNMYYILNSIYFQYLFNNKPRNRISFDGSKIYRDGFILIYIQYMVLLSPVIIPSFDIVIPAFSETMN